MKGESLCVIFGKGQGMAWGVKERGASRASGWKVEVVSHKPTFPDWLAISPTN